MATKLEQNTLDLQALLEAANELPEEKKIQGSKTVSPTTSEQTVTPDSGYDGIGSVTVNAMPSVTQATPMIAVDASGLITAQSIQQSGYVETGTKTATRQLSTQAAATITPTKSSQTAVAKNVYTTGVVTVDPIPEQYQDISGVTATPNYVAKGYSFVNNDGETVEGVLVADKIYVTHDDGSNEISARISGIGAGTVMMVDGDELGNAVQNHVLEGTTFSGGGGYYINVTGTMSNNGSVSQTIDGLETQSVSIPQGYTTGGTVALDSTIDDTADSQASLIDEISALLDGKSVSGGSASYKTCNMTFTYTGLGSGLFYLYGLHVVDGALTVFNGFNSLTYKAYETITVENVLCGSILVCSAGLSNTIDGYSVQGDYLTVLDVYEDVVVMQLSEDATGDVSVVLQGLD